MPSSSRAHIIPNFQYGWGSSNKYVHGMQSRPIQMIDAVSQPPLDIEESYDKKCLITGFRRKNQLARDNCSFFLLFLFFNQLGLYSKEQLQKANNSN